MDGLRLASVLVFRILTKLIEINDVCDLSNDLVLASVAWNELLSEADASL